MGFALGSAFKVGNSEFIQAPAYFGFLTIPSSGLPEAAAEVKRYDLGVKSNVNREFNSQANL